MFESVTVVGRGRVGSALCARLAERGVPVREAGGSLVVLCVPDRAIAAAARAVAPGPWVAHVSGATSLAALDPHERRFSVHPLQTFTLGGGPEQFDGAWAATTAASADGAARATWLADCLGLRPFPLADEQRTLYHAGAVIASNYLVTLYRSAGHLLELAGAPPEALVPLMRHTIDAGFELTGPIARGDWEVVEAHTAELERRTPAMAALYRALAAATTR